MLPGGFSEMMKSLNVDDDEWPAQAILFLLYFLYILLCVRLAIRVKPAQFQELLKDLFFHPLKILATDPSIEGSAFR